MRRFPSHDGGPRVKHLTPSFSHPTRPNEDLLAELTRKTPRRHRISTRSAPDRRPGRGLRYHFVDLARKYDGLADFPSSPNPYSVADAVAGALFLRDYDDGDVTAPRSPGGRAPHPPPRRFVPSTTGDLPAIARVPDPTDPTTTVDVRSPSPAGIAVIPTSGNQFIYYTEIMAPPLLIPLRLPLA